MPVDVLEVAPILDGFTYNLFLRDLPYRYYPTLTAQMEVLRRANNYRPRWYITPDDLFQPIPAYGQIEKQIRVTPQSYIWGWSCLSYDGEGEGPEPATFRVQNATDMNVKVVESCNGVELFGDYIAGSGLQGIPMRGGTTYGFLVTPFCQPRLILEPGLVNVIITNNLAIDQYAQFTLYTAEPCEQTRQD